jgi:hypothetical protein
VIGRAVLRLSLAALEPTCEHAMSNPEEKSVRAPPPSADAVATDTWEHGRQYAIYTGNSLLGTSNLEYPVQPLKRVAGRFQPTPAFDELSSVFQRYARAVATGDRRMLRTYVEQRDRLRLELWAGGVRLDALVELITTWVNGIHIVHISSSDDRLWRPRLHPD